MELARGGGRGRGVEREKSREVRWLRALVAYAEDTVLIPQNQHGGSQPPITPVPRVLMMFSGPYVYMIHRHTGR